MLSTAIMKRHLENVGHQVWEAIEVLEREFGGVLTHDSGHGRRTNSGAPTWVFTFPRHGNAQIAVAMNRQTPTLLMRAKTVDGRPLEPLLGDSERIARRYSDPEKGVSSSALGKHAPFLNPSPENPLLRVTPASGSIRSLIKAYLGSSGETTAEDVDDIAAIPPRAKSPRPISEEDFQNQMNRRSEVGRAGEFHVVRDEIERLRARGCFNPEAHVRRIAETNVSAGYDVESTWPGEERCIEVKSTTRDGSDLFITENERAVLTDLGDRAWLYRVIVGSDGAPIVQTRLRDPMKSIQESDPTPIAWRVPASALVPGE